MRATSLSPTVCGHMPGHVDDLRSTLATCADYGNKFGEPLIAGYTRSFGARLPGGERREWLKPIMFSGGVGTMDHTHAEKHEGQLGMLVVKIGGPAYRIGMGEGAQRRSSSSTMANKLTFQNCPALDAWQAVAVHTPESVVLHYAPLSPPQAAVRRRRCRPGARMRSWTSTRCSAGTRRWPRSSGAWCGRASRWAGGTRLCRFTTRARAATATWSRRSSTRWAPRSTSGEPAGDDAGPVARCERCISVWSCKGDAAWAADGCALLLL